MNILVNICKDSTATLVLHKKSSNLPIKKGVRQGDTTSPMLFTACLEEVFKLFDWEGLGVRINGEYLSNLRFADDIVIFNKYGDELQQMIEHLTTFLEGQAAPSRTKQSNNRSVMPLDVRGRTRATLTEAACFYPCL